MTPDERLILGAMMLSHRAVERVVDQGWPPSVFSEGVARTAYECALELHRDGVPVDALTVVSRLEETGRLEPCGGPAAIDALPAGVPRVTDVGAVIRRVGGA